MSSSEQNALWDVWHDKSPITISGTQYTLKGFSIAALRTNFFIKELGVMFDAGLSAPYAAEHIFVIHSHTDHIANLPFHLYSAKPNSKIQIYCPEQSCKNVDIMLKSMVNINNETPDIEKSNPYYDLIPVKEGILNLIIGKKKFKIEIIKCFHTVPCLGYGLIEIRNKLKDEYSGLSSQEIGQLRKSGVEITQEVEYPIICYLGDTSKEVLKDPRIKKYKNIMIECTFLEKEDMEQADKTCHMHWDYLKEYIETHQENVFILYHFSRRYKKSEIVKFFENIDLKNIIPWIN